MLYHIIKFNRDINVIIRLLFQLGQKNNRLNMARLDMQNVFAIFLFTETNPRRFLHLLVNGNISTYSFNNLVQTSGSLSLTKSAILKNPLQSIKSNVSTMFLLIKLVDCLEKRLIYRHIRRFAD